MCGHAHKVYKQGWLDAAVDCYVISGDAHLVGIWNSRQSLGEPGFMQPEQSFSASKLVWFIGMIMFSPELLSYLLCYSSLDDFRQ